MLSNKQTRQNIKNNRIYIYDELLKEIKKKRHHLINLIYNKYLDHFDYFEYFDMCKIIVNVDGYNIIYIKQILLSIQQYYDISVLVVKSNYKAIDKIKMSVFTKFTKKQKYRIYEIVFKQNIYILKKYKDLDLVILNKMSNFNILQEYIIINKIIFPKDIMTLIYYYLLKY